MRNCGRLPLVFLLLLGCSDADLKSIDPSGFEEFAWQTGTPDVRNDRLCPAAADPDRAPVEETFIECEVEGATFAPGEPDATPERLDVVTWNVERGFESDAQIDMLVNGAFGPIPDILLLSEADRGCERTDFRNVTREFAEAFGYYYVFATEFIELPGARGPTGPYDPPLCEHGNSIVSRYPLGNVVAIRHAENRSWYTPPDFPEPDEPRLGGRVALRADANVDGRLVRLYVVHYESEVETLHIRDAQADEVALDGLDAETVIVGGDFNAYGASSDLRTGQRNDNPTQSFLSRGYVDAHGRLDPDDRQTSTAVPLTIDFVFSRGIEAEDAGLCPLEQCGGLSDHLPLWAVFPMR